MVGFFLYGAPAKEVATHDCTRNLKGQHAWLFKNRKRNLKLLQMFWISENWGFSYFVVQIDFKEGRHIVLLIFTQSLEPHKILLIGKVEILFINCLANDAAFTNYMMRRRTRPLNWKWVGSVMSQNASMRRYCHSKILLGKYACDQNCLISSFVMFIAVFCLLSMLASLNRVFF